jgi:hypothetical protein
MELYFESIKQVDEATELYRKFQMNSGSWNRMESVDLITSYIY